MNNKPILYVAAGGLALVLGLAAYLATDKTEVAAPEGVAEIAPAQKVAAEAPKDPAARRWSSDDGLTQEQIREKYSSNGQRPKYIKALITLSRDVNISKLDRAKALLGQIPSLPEDGKEFAMWEATALIPDADYLAMRPWLSQLAATDAMKEIVVTDVLNRGDDIRFPSLVDFLRQPKNGQTEEVRETLVAFLDKDYGNDYAQWDVAVRKFLAENAD